MMRVVARGGRRVVGVTSGRVGASGARRVVVASAGLHTTTYTPLWARLNGVPRRVSLPVIMATNARAMSSLPEHIVVTMPALSPTMTQGTIVSWSVSPGDEVSAGDQLGEIETDKATMSFDSTEDGYVAKLLVDEGTADISLGSPVLVLCEEASDVEAFADFVSAVAPTEAAPAPTEAPAPAPAASPTLAPTSAPATPRASGDRVFASPLAKRMASEVGIPLAVMTGTGGNGRVTKADVLAFKAALDAAPAQPTASSSAPASGAYTDIDLTNMRKTIAKRLMESKQTIPHYYLTVDVNMDNVVAIRKKLNEIADGKYKLSVNDFIIKASALAMKHVPEVNSSWQGDFIRQYSTVDVCVAVSTDEGLITPIVKNAHAQGLSSISSSVKDLATRARDGTLAPEEFMGGTFTISNLGMFGISNFSAIVNPPQSCILAVGTTERTVVPDATSDNGLGVSEMLSCTLSCDHRVVDGAVGAQWLKHFRNYLENPMSMIL